MNLGVGVSSIEKTKDATEMTEKLVFIFYFRKVRLNAAASCYTG